MLGQLASWGGSVALRIPAAFIQELGVRAGQSVDLTVEQGALVVRILSEQKKYRLEDLVSGITEENRHSEADFGLDVGKEITHHDNTNEFTQRR